MTGMTTTRRLAQLAGLMLCMAQGLLSSPPAAAIEFDEVRDFDDVFVTGTGPY
jgi:hypothetical protein